MVLAMTVAIGAAASVTNAQMVAGWLFDEGAGSVAKDTQGYGIDLLLYGDTTWDSDVPPDLVGISTRSITLDGSGDYGEVRSGAMEYIKPPDTGGPWTIMLWERISSYVNNSSPMDMGGSFRIGIYDDEIEIGVSVGGSWYYATGGSINDKDWHHLCGSYDGTTVRSYVDGVETGSFDISSYDTDSSTFRIGRGVDWGSVYNGKIDEAAIFHEVLDAITIKSLMENGIGTFVNSNLAPFVDCGPAKAMVIPQWPDQGPPVVHYPGVLALDGYAVDNTPWPAGDPCGLTAVWEVLTAPLGGSVTFATDPTNLQNTAYFKEKVVGVYRLQIRATDGFFEVNDYLLVDVKHYRYTGLQNHWEFENDLQDTAELYAPYSTTNDYLEDRGLIPIYYGPGVIGQAVHVGHTDYAGKWGWLESPFPHTAQRPDLNLQPNFTVEMYVQPTLEMATSESDQLSWQDLFGRFFTYTAGQETFFESYEFIIDDGRPLLNAADITDDINKPRNTDWVRSGLLGAHAFPKVLGWQHLAFVGDGNGNITFYIDGEDVGTGSLPNAEFVQTVAPLRVANPKVNAHGGVGRPSPYVGWIDDIKFFEYDKSPSYMCERARLIPLQSPTPVDGYQYAYPDVVLAWAPVKGFPDETPTYDVYTARGLLDPLVLAFSGLTDTYYDPCEVGNVTDLNFDTTYRWQIVAQTSIGPISSAEWSFKTIAADFLGLDGTALIGHWKFDEGTGTDAHDLAGADDVAYYNWADPGPIVLPTWIPGWIAANPATAINLPGYPKPFGYFVVEADDINQYINLPRGSYTLATWMKTTPDFFFESIDFIGFGTSYGLGRNDDGQEAFFSHNGFSGTLTRGSTPIGDGYWHHVAAVYEAPTPVKETLAYIYVDGQLDATEEVDGNHSVDLLATLMIGANSAEANNFTGALDDVRIYQRALSADEIEALFDMGIVNAPPTVHAGINTVVPFPQLTVDLEIIMSDDANPLQQSPRTAWTQLSGPGTITFDPCIIEAGDHVGFVKDVDITLTTTLTFSEPGFYNVRFKADDSIYTHEDSVRIWVQKAVEEFPTTVAYWRFDEDTPETDYRGSGDDPNTLVIANEVASGPPMIAERNQPEDVPQVTLDAGVMHSVIPLTGDTNVNALSPGAGERGYYGNRLNESGIDLTMAAETWDGLVFCEDGITVETYVNLDTFNSGTQELNWTIFDALAGGKGLEFRNVNDSNDPDGDLDHLRFEFYVSTGVPNEYERVYIMSEIKTLRMGWMHLAFTYDMDTGAARVYQNGIPVWLTHYYDGGWREYRPWVDRWQGEPGRTFVLDEELAVSSYALLNCESFFDELRITAEPLWAQRLLVKGPAECAEKVQGDLDGDCDVDVYDLKLFCDSWLMCNNADPTQCFK